MSLYEQLVVRRKKAMKAKDVAAKDIVGYVLALCKQVLVDQQKDALTDEEVIKIIKKELKSRKESLGFLQQGGSAEDVTLEQAKIAVLEGYLPAMLDEAATRVAVEQVIAREGIDDLKKQRGVVIRAVIQEYGSGVDAGVVNKIVSGLL